MKFIVSESQSKKLFMSIYNFIEDMYDLDDLQIEGDEHHGYEGVINFWSNDYDFRFKIYLPEYWDQETEGGLNAFKRSPILQIPPKDQETLNSWFNERWHEPMKRFIKDNFNIEIKSFMT